MSENKFKWHGPWVEWGNNHADPNDKPDPKISTHVVISDEWYQERGETGKLCRIYEVDKNTIHLIEVSKLSDKRTWYGSGHGFRWRYATKFEIEVGYAMPHKKYYIDCGTSIELSLTKKSFPQVSVIWQQSETDRTIEWAKKRDKVYTMKEFNEHMESLKEEE